MSADSLLVLDQVTKQYPNQQLPAVDRISLSLSQGELLGLLGPSGCGKTTLLRLIAGFERAQAGTIELLGRQVCGQCWVPPERRDVGVVFQDYALFPHLTVFGNVAFGLAQGKRMPKPKVRELVCQSISLVGLKGFEKRYPHELSGGQQQRVALARALAPRPSLVLLDEPFSNLDVQVRLYLRQEVRDILKGVGTAGIFVTHDQEEALAIADRVAILRQGQIEQMGLPETIYCSPASRFVAAFVTQANFVPAHRQPQGWETPLGFVPVHQVQATAEAAQTSGELMVRQEALRLVADPSASSVVQDRLFLGREYQYRVQLSSGQVVYVRLPLAQAFGAGERVRVELRADGVDLGLCFFTLPGGQSVPVTKPTVSL
ncbi:MAG: ABC transporter ATP-binding protein [Cyanobacteria bacterium J06648_16]